MIQYWSTKTSVTSTADDIRTLSLNVLSSAGFGKSYPFQGHDDSTKSRTAAATTTHKDSLKTILDNCVLLFLLGSEFIKKPWLPKRIQDLNTAMINFKQYMIEIYEAEKQAMALQQPASPNLMTQLVRASLGSDGLSESEIYGNLFVFSFAGHDTTANTLAITMFLLATSQEIQDWIAEELNAVFGNKPPSTWDYITSFPRLKRTLAVLYETGGYGAGIVVADTASGEDAFGVEAEAYIRGGIEIWKGAIMRVGAFRRKVYSVHT